MKHKPKQLWLVLSAASLALGACNGGSSTSGGTNSGSPQSTSYASVAQNATPQASTCIGVSAQSITASQWNVGGKVTLKNNCSSNQTLDGTNLIMSSDSSNLTRAFSLYNLAQSNDLIVPKSGWVEHWVASSATTSVVKNSVSGRNDLSITLNTADKSAYLVPGGSTNLEFGYNPAGVNLGTITFKSGGDVPDTPGTIQLSLDTKQLSSVCTSTTTCNIPVHLTGQNGTFDQVIDTITNAKSGKVLSYTFKDLKAGTYGFSVNNNDLPAKVQFVAPASFALASGATVSESAVFKTITITTGNVKYSLVKPSTFSTEQSSVAVQLTATTGGSIYNGTNSFTAANFNNVEKGSYALSTAYGLADALSGKYANPIKKTGVKVTAESTIDLGALSYPTRNSSATVTVKVTGLASGDSAAIKLTDNLNGVSYLYNQLSLKTGSTALKLLESDNVVLNITTSDKYKPIAAVNYSVVKNGVITLNFESANQPLPPESGAYYNYAITKDQYGNPVLGFNIYGISSAIKKVTLSSNVAPKTGGFPSCFGIAAGQYTIASSDDSAKQQYQTEFTPAGGATFSLTNHSCGNFLYQDSKNYAFVMRSQLETSGTTLPDILFPSVSGVTVELANGQKVSLPEKREIISNVDPGHGKVLQGYYASWGIYNGMNFGPDKIPYTRFNTLNYAFTYFKPDTGEVYAGDYNADGTALPMIAQEIRKYPYMKVYLSTGGWTNFKNGSPVKADTMFDTLTSSDARISKFATTLVAAMTKLGFQGVNVDWEWWASTQPDQFSNDQAKRMLKLYTAVRQALDAQGAKDGKHYDFDIAVGAGKDKIIAPERVYPGYWNQVYALVDHIGLMSYDMHGGWDVNQPAYFQAPWKMEAGNPYTATGYDISSALASYQSYISAKPLSKFQIGVPAYGRALQVASLSNGGVLQTGVADGIGQRSAETSLWDYKCIINAAVCTQSGQRTHSLTLVDQNSTGANKTLWDKYSKDNSYEPWGYGVAGGQSNVFMTYDDTYSVSKKTQEAKALGLGGMMLWEIDGDASDDAHSLAKAMSNELAK